MQPYYKDLIYEWNMHSRAAKYISMIIIFKVCSVTLDSTHTDEILYILSKSFIID